MWRIRALLTVVFAIAAVASAADVAEFTVLNTSDAARDEHLCVSIPFNPGDVADEAALAGLVVEGKPTAWRVLTRYPDGSVMIAQAQAKFALKAGQKATFRIVAGRAADAPVRLPAAPSTLPITLTLTRDDGKVFTASVKRDKVMEATAMRRVARYRGVIVDESGKEPLGVTVYQEDWFGSDRGYMDVMIAADSLNKPLPVVKFKEVSLTFGGMSVAPCWAQKEAGMVVEPVEGATRVVLMHNDYFGDNTGKAYRFAYGPIGDDYVDLMARRPLYPLATPETFKARQAGIGILGYVPSLPAGVTQEKAWDYLTSRYLGEYDAAAGPWDHLGHACMKGPGATGDQADFGVLALFRTYQTGHPGELYSVVPAMFRESCRMNHFYGLDARTLLPRKAVFWTERVNERVWPKGLLGRGQAHWDVIYKGRYHHDWGGYDEEHFSLNNKYEAWTLTGDWFIHSELALHYETIALGTLNHFWYSHGLGNRAMGRMAHAAMLAARAVGDPWLVEQMVEKYAAHAVDAFEQNKKDFAAHKVAAFALWRNCTDGRIPNLVGGTVKTNDLVCNWQEGLIAWAVGQLPDERMKQMAYEAGKSMCLNGFDFESGRPKTYYAAADPSRFKSGGIGTTWFYPSMRWAATEAVRCGDADAAKMKQAADRALESIRKNKLEGGVFAPWQRWTAIPEQ